MNQPEPPAIDIDAARLHDIVLSEPVRYLPETVGWYVAGGLALALVAWMTIRWMRRHRAHRYRREALAELTRIEAALADPAERAAALGCLPVLVKRVALAAYPREEVASLSGDAWLARLDASIGADAFTRGDGQLLPTLAYAPMADLQAVSDERARALVALVRLWIRMHRAGV